jgi:hypothetical protein
MSTLKGFILLTVTHRSSSIQRGGTVAFPWQKWLGKRAKMLLYVYVYWLTCYEKEKQSQYRSGQDLRTPSLGSRFQDTRHVKVARLSALRTGRLHQPPYHKSTSELECGRQD